MPSTEPVEGKCGSALRGKPGQFCLKNPMSNGRCERHGGKSPRGLEHPSFIHGRYSKSVPARLAHSYEEAVADARRVELNDELALVIARNQELLSSLYSGESDGLWTRLRNLKRQMEAARRNAQSAAERGDVEGQARYKAQSAEALNALLRIVERGATDAERWDELMRNVEGQRRLSESERKRRVEEHQIVTTEEVVALMGALLSVITRHVKDERVRQAIGTDLDALISGDAPMGELEAN